MECDLVPREGFNIETVKITNLSRKLSAEGFKHNVDTVKNVLHSVPEAKRIIRNFSPDAVIGTGGYVCYPVLTAAHQLHIPTVIHESNAFPGLTTKLLSHTVDRILVGVEGCAEAYADPSRVVYTGTPVRNSFSCFTKEKAKTELGISPDKKLLVSVWGSLGAGHMNDIMLDFIPLIRDNPGFKLIHATGKRYYKDFMEKLSESFPDYENYDVEIYEYIHDMPRIMSAADLIMCRAGASTLSELEYMGKPSVLVPSPNVTGNHQEKNARVVEKAGGAKVMPEEDFDSKKLFDTVSDILFDDSRLKCMSDCTSSMCIRDSASRICDIVLDLITSKE